MVKDATGRVVWDNDAFAFLGGDCPQTANPSLWRQSQLCARQAAGDQGVLQRLLGLLGTADPGFAIVTP